MNQLRPGDEEKSIIDWSPTHLYLYYCYADVLMKVRHTYTFPGRGEHLFLNPLYKQTPKNMLTYKFGTSTRYKVAQSLFQRQDKLAVS